MKDNRGAGRWQTRTVDVLSTNFPSRSAVQAAGPNALLITMMHMQVCGPAAVLQH